MDKTPMGASEGIGLVRLEHAVDSPWLKELLGFPLSEQNIASMNTQLDGLSNEKGSPRRLLDDMGLFTIEESRRNRVLDRTPPDPTDIIRLMRVGQGLGWSALNLADKYTSLLVQAGAATEHIKAQIAASAQEPPTETRITPQSVVDALLGTRHTQSSMPKEPRQIPNSAQGREKATNAAQSKKAAFLRNADPALIAKYTELGLNPEDIVVMRNDELQFISVDFAEEVLPQFNHLIAKDDHALKSAVLKACNYESRKGSLSETMIEKIQRLINLCHELGTNPSLLLFNDPGLASLKSETVRLRLSSRLAALEELGFNARRSRQLIDSGSVSLLLSDQKFELGIGILGRFRSIDRSATTTANIKYLIGRFSYPFVSTYSLMQQPAGFSDIDSTEFFQRYHSACREGWNKAEFDDYIQAHRARLEVDDDLHQLAFAIYNASATTNRNDDQIDS